MALVFWDGSRSFSDKRVSKGSMWNPKNSGTLYPSTSTSCRCNSMVENIAHGLHGPSCTTMTKDGVSILIPRITAPIKWCFWKKPQPGCIKLNTDGSVIPGNSAFSGLFRDDKGDPICAFVTKSFEDDVFLVELWAIWRGLMLASDLGMSTIWVESDSSNAVKAINRELMYGPEIGCYLSQIWELLDGFENHLVTHSWREANRAADYLSKMRVSEDDDLLLWPVDFPNTLRNIIKEDAQGKIYFRP